VFKKLLVNAPPEIVRNPLSSEVATWAKLIHPDDAAILAAATAIKPDYLVTGDKHFYANPEIAEKSGLKNITPAEFVRLLK